MKVGRFLDRGKVIEGSRLGEIGLLQNLFLAEAHGLSGFYKHQHVSRRPGRDQLIGDLRTERTQ